MYERIKNEEIEEYFIQLLEFVDEELSYLKNDNSIELVDSFVGWGENKIKKSTNNGGINNGEKHV